jgi:signal transduction histidine kinase/DNA-binding response OmpR family regulator
MAALEIDDSGHIWVSTKAGISRINHQDYSIQNYDTDDGLLCLEFINKSSYRDEEGWIYFGGRHGFNVFHPDSIKDNLHIPPVYITALDVDHQPKYFEEPVFKMNNIELSYHENDFSFSFVALNYVNPKKNQFAYMLEGYDNDWIYVGNERTAHYTNMSPGDYIFRVKASNNNGYWNEEGTSIALVIHPPVWKKWWAYLVYSLAIVGIIYFFYRNELRRLNLKRDLEIEHIQKEKLIEIDREKSNFFANVSHEFRTPLTLILNPIDKVISVLKDGKNKQELSIAYRNAKRLQTLINQLLSLSKLESGKMKLRIKEENIVRLIRANVQSFESLARQNEIDLLFESSVENYLIMVDRLKVGKIMNNLLSNAFKFTDYRGTIKVNISLASKPTDSLEANRQTKSGMNKTTAGISSEIEGVQIKVSDTGIGIRQEYISHIFNRFYQVDSGHNKGYEGTGIGLSLTKELVDLHHGTINVESEIDVGTTFIVFLPAGIDQLNEQGIADSNSLEKRDDNELLDDEYIYSSTSLVDNMSKAEEEDTNKILPKILIVDDNSDMRWFIRNHLEHSYKIVEAVNGEDGFNKAIEHIPDLIITDLMMPVLDGNELTRKVKLDQQTSHIPVIILTAKATLESKLEGLETGADDFLTKPFDAQELIIRIRNLIDLREKLRMSLSKHIDEVKQTKALLEYSCIGLSKLDEEFLKKAVSVIEDQLVNPDFNVESFAAEMAMSRKHLHRKLTSLTDHSPNNLIRNIRLMKAAELIKEGKLNITQISYEVGISSLSYFAKIFKDRFGVSPSDFS